MANAEFEDQQAPRLESTGRLIDEPPDDRQPVVPSEEGDGRLMIAYFRLQRRAISIGHVGRIRDDEIDRPGSRGSVQPVQDVGLGYLRLGEPTPSLSGGESQRLRIASRLRSSQRGALYVFDEPSTGLHPLDVATLVGVFDRLLEAGATIIAIDHDLDLLAAADHLIDMGPGGGPDGGRILAAGTPEDVMRTSDSVTGPWLAQQFGLPSTR